MTTSHRKSSLDRGVGRLEHGDAPLELALEQVARSERRSRRNAIVATLVPVALGIAFLAVTYSQVDDLQTRKRALEGRYAVLQTESAALLAQNEDLEGQNASLQAQRQQVNAEVAALQGTQGDLQRDIEEKQRQLAKLEEEVALLEPLAGEALGRRPERIVGASAEIQAGARAAKEAAALAGAAEESTRRSGLTIIHYAKKLEQEVNLDVVLRSLRKWGFRVESRSSDLEIPTNAIWFGKDVQDDDVRLVALTLMGAGVEIRWISRFRDWEGPKRARIEVGSWGKVVGFEPWTSESVTSTTDLAEAGNPAHPDVIP